MIVLAKFATERNIIENLDLQSFPVSIKYSDVPQVQKSVLKVSNASMYILYFQVLHYSNKRYVYFCRLL